MAAFLCLKRVDRNKMYSAPNTRRKEKKRRRGYMRGHGFSWVPKENLSTERSPQRLLHPVTSMHRSYWTQDVDAGERLAPKNKF